MFRDAAGNPVSYGDLNSMVARYAGALKSLGVAQGDRVTVQVEKSLANVALYLAVVKIGAIYNPLNTAYTSAELDYFISDAEPSLVVVAPGRREAIEPLAAKYGVKALETLDDSGEGSLAARAATASEDFEIAVSKADDLAALLYTSGTTGRSKGAMITHGNLVSNTTSLSRIWKFSENDVLLHALPIFHVHGLFVALGVALMSGAEILWLPKYNAAEVVNLLPRATVMMGVPTFYTRLLDQPAFGTAQAGHMRLFVSGSAPLLADTHRQFHDRTGHRILERYGMTETCMTTSNPYDGERLAGTVGYPLPDVEVRVAGEDGKECPAGEPGVLEVRGPNVFSGYWHMPEKTAEEFRPDGFFITGDVAVSAPDGRISIVGRAKDLIITGGFNVYPKEIESEIDAMDGVTESAVIGVPHPDFGEGVVAVVAANGAGTPGESEIISALEPRLAKFKLPKRVFFVADLPRNTMGKVQKAALRQQFAATFAKPAG